MNLESHRYFIINKPYNMVSQFVSTDKVRLLGDLDFDFPKSTHAIGRLDNHSEGLLILTTNKKVTRLLFQGDKLHTRTYIVQVKNNVSEERLRQLKTGIKIRVKGGSQWKTTPCEVEIIRRPNYNYEPVELEKSYPPYTWLRISLKEGKFHQVRKMVAAVHHKCRRLIRLSIEDLSLENLPPGGVKEINEKKFFELLKIETWKG
jgi:23S rRNA pseudouridine2457 synthase